MVSKVEEEGSGVHVRGKLFGTWHGCVVDERDHLIRDEEFGRRENQGRYRAVCGHVVVPGSMLLPPALLCRRCAGWVRAHEQLRSEDQPRSGERRRHRRPGLLRRLLGRNESPDVPPPGSLCELNAPERGGRTPTSSGMRSALTAPVPAGVGALRRAR